MNDKKKHLTHEIDFQKNNLIHVIQKVCFLKKISNFGCNKMPKRDQFDLNDFKK